ncbi:MAG TPA: orotate phosphoribosyltransferase [Actinomycetota bacterium]|nr:orotate phosphoribosyltransferase [Actinomycetota bacterium]
MTPDEATALFERHGAMRSGHFQLSSGRHSDRYVQKARVLERPEATMALAQEIASWYPAVDVVVAPAVGAVVLGFAVGIAARARSIFAERERGRMLLRRGFVIEPGERALVVEDVVTTGGSAREVWDLVGEAGAERLGVAALIDRTSGPPGLPLRAILRIDAASWDPSDCPLCRGGAPLDAPGSRHLV